VPPTAASVPGWPADSTPTCSRRGPASRASRGRSTSSRTAVLAAARTSTKPFLKPAFPCFP